MAFQASLNHIESHKETKIDWIRKIMVMVLNILVSYTG